MRIAIDTGGTFTDCLFVVDGRLEILKIPSTPADPSEAVLRAVAQISDGRGAEVRHGTNTIAIGRQARPKLYDLFSTQEPPLAPAQLRFGVAERVAAEGTVLRSTTAEEPTRLREAIRAAGPEDTVASTIE